jgi:hypothetical protein
MCGMYIITYFMYIPQYPEQVNQRVKPSNGWSGILIA